MSYLEVFGGIIWVRCTRGGFWILHALDLGQHTSTSTTRKNERSFFLLFFFPSELFLHISSPTFFAGQDALQKHHWSAAPSWICTNHPTPGDPCPARVLEVRGEEETPARTTDVPLMEMENHAKTDNLLQTAEAVETREMRGSQQQERSRGKRREMQPAEGVPK